MSTGFWAAAGIGVALIVSAVLAVVLVVGAGLSVPLGLGILAVLDGVILAGGYWYLKRAFRAEQPTPLDETVARPTS